MPEVRAALVVVLAALLVGLAGCARDEAPRTNAESGAAPATAPGAAKDAYQLEVTHWEGPVGEEGYVLVAITAKGDNHINAAYPQKLKLDAPAAGLALPHRELRMKDAQLEDGKRLLFTVPVTAERTGEYALAGKIHLSVCSDAQCHIDKAPVSARVVAQ